MLKRDGKELSGWDSDGVAASLSKAGSIGALADRCEIGSFVEQGDRFGRRSKGSLLARQPAPRSRRMALDNKVPADAAAGMTYCLPQFCCSSTTSVAFPIAAIVCASV